MTTLLFVFLTLSIFNASVVIRAKNVQNYPADKNFSQKLAIDNCALGLNLL